MSLLHHSRAVLHSHKGKEESALSCWRGLSFNLMAVYNFVTFTVKLSVKTQVTLCT